MPQKRDLMPLTVYLSTEHKAKAEKRAEQKGVATGTLLRMILIGQEKPLGSRGSS